MKRYKLVIIALVSALILLTAGCGGGNDYALECNIDTEQYGFKISGEDGPITVQTKGETTSTFYDPNGKVSGISVEVNRTLTFEDSGNSYDIVGDIHVDFQTDVVEYDITASGDTFAEPQSCKQ